MPKRTPAEGAKRWREQFGTFAAEAGPRVQRITKNPMQLALAQGDLWQRKMREDGTYQKWRRNLEKKAADLAGWKSRLINGLRGVGEKLSEHEKAYQAAATPLYAYMDVIKAEVDAEIPRGDLETNIRRSAFIIRRLKDYATQP